jgi:UDP-glucose 4-epimerase
VNRGYELLLEIFDKDLPSEHGPAKPGEQRRRSVDPVLVGRVLWRREVERNVGLKETLRCFAAL